MKSKWKKIRKSHGKTATNRAKSIAWLFVRGRQPDERSCSSLVRRRNIDIFFFFCLICRLDNARKSLHIRSVYPGLNTLFFLLFLIIFYSFAFLLPGAFAAITRLCVSNNAVEAEEECVKFAFFFFLRGPPPHTSVELGAQRAPETLGGALKDTTSSPRIYGSRSERIKFVFHPRARIGGAQRRGRRTVCRPSKT